jgi:hypothetical protein
MILAIGAFFNYHYKGYFFPADVKRILIKFNPENDLEHKSLEKFNSYKEKLSHYLFHTIEEEASFYYSILPERLAWDQNFLSDQELKEHNRRFSQNEILNFLYRNNPKPSIDKTLPIKYLDYSNPKKNKLNYLIQITYKLFYIFFYKTRFVLILFWLIIGYFTVTWFRQNYRENSAFRTMNVLIGIHLLSILLLVVGHPIYVTRYVTVTEFIPLLIIALFSDFVIKETNLTSGNWFSRNVTNIIV